MCRCSVPCGRAQLSVSLWLVWPFVNACGGNGVVEEGRLCFFVISLLLFQSCPISTVIIPDMKRTKVGSCSCPVQDLLKVTSILSCPYFIGGKTFICFFFCFDDNMLELLRPQWSPSCLGPGSCPWHGVCFGVVWLELWSVAPTASRWWAAPRWPSCCATWWAVSSGLKTFFSRCKAEIQTDSGTRAKRSFGVTHQHVSVFEKK